MLLQKNQLKKNQPKKIFNSLKAIKPKLSKLINVNSLINSFYNNQKDIAS